MRNLRLYKFYKKVVCEDFLLLYNFTNIAALPKFERVVLNSTSNHFTTSKISVIQSFCTSYLATGQKCMSTKARKSIDTFKIRQSNLLGVKACLRNEALFCLLEKLSIFVLPKLFSKNKVQKNELLIEKKNEQNENLALGVSKNNLNVTSYLKQPQKGYDKNKQYHYCVENELVKKKHLILQQILYQGKKDKQFGKLHLSCFTISHYSCLCFLEASQLSLFFGFENTATIKNASDLGFSLFFLFKPLKDRVVPRKYSNAISIRSPQNYTEDYCSIANCYVTSALQSFFGLAQNRLVVVSDKIKAASFRESQIQQHLLSAFCISTNLRFSSAKKEV